MLHSAVVFGLRPTSPCFATTSGTSNSRPAQTTHIAIQPLTAKSQTELLSVTDTSSAVGMKGARHHPSDFGNPLSFRGVGYRSFPFTTFGPITALGAMPPQSLWCRPDLLRRARLSSHGDYKDTPLYMSYDILFSRTRSGPLLQFSINIHGVKLNQLHPPPLTFYRCVSQLLSILVSLPVLEELLHVACQEPRLRQEKPDNWLR